MNTVSPLNMAKADQKGNILKEYIWPVLKNYVEYAFNTQNYNCTKIKPARLIVKLFNIMNLGMKVYELTGSSYILDWSTGPPVINACQFLDNAYQTSTCFVLTKAGEVKQHYVTCEEVALKVKAVADKLYYPYTDNPVSGKQVHWLALKGNGGFAPDGSINTTALTNEQGEATVTWKLSSLPASDHLARAMTMLHDGSSLSRVDFNTASYTPAPTTKILDGDNQSGVINKGLAKPLIFSVQDAKDILPMGTDLFDLTWEVKGESVSFSIKSKTCDWQIQGNPVTFKATAVDPIITSVQITPDNLTLKKDETVTLTAAAYNASGKEVPVEASQWQWKDDNGGIVSVTGNGNQANVKGLNAGKATVVAIENGSGVKASVNLVVVADAAKIVIEAGNNQFRNTAGYLPENLKVKLTDASDNPLAGAKLKWEISSGKGKLDYAITTTDVNGISENKFFVDYSNEKHDVKVSVIGKEEINATFLETLRLVPMGDGIYWNYGGEQFWDYKKSGPDIWQSAKLGNNGIICGNSSGWKGEVCYSNLYYDKNQTDFYFNWGIGTGLEDVKHYFKDGDTLKVIPMHGNNEIKNYVKILKIISDTEILVQIASPNWFTTGSEGGNPTIVFAGWQIYNQFIKRGVGITRSEIWIPKISWGDHSYRPTSLEVPSIADCALQFYSDLKDYKVVE